MDIPSSRWRRASLRRRRPRLEFGSGPVCRNSARSWSADDRPLIDGVSAMGKPGPTRASNSLSGSIGGSATSSEGEGVIELPLCTREKRSRRGGHGLWFARPGLWTHRQHGFDEQRPADLDLALRIGADVEFRTALERDLFALGAEKQRFARIVIEGECAPKFDLGSDGDAHARGGVCRTLFEVFASGARGNAPIIRTVMLTARRLFATAQLRRSARLPHARRPSPARTGSRQPAVDGSPRRAPRPSRPLFLGKCQPNASRMAA